VRRLLKSNWVTGVTDIPGKQRSIKVQRRHRWVHVHLLRLGLITTPPHPTGHIHVDVDHTLVQLGHEPSPRNLVVGWERTGERKGKRELFVDPHNL